MKKLILIFTILTFFIGNAQQDKPSGYHKDGILFDDAQTPNVETLWYNSFTNQYGIIRYDRVLGKFRVLENGTWKDLISSGDNLGNHTLTENLDLANFNITNSLSNNINIGIDDTTAAYVNIYGGNTSVGGYLGLFNGASKDTNRDVWYITADGDFQIRGADAYGVIVVDDVTEGVTIPQMDLADYATLGNKSIVTEERLQDYVSTNSFTLPDDLKLGDEDTTNGSLTVHGNSTTTGGKVILENPADNDTEINDYSWETINGNLILKSNGGTNGSVVPVFTVNSSTLQTGFGNYEFPRADGTAGQVLTTDGSGNVTFEDIPTPSFDGVERYDTVADLPATGVSTTSYKVTADPTSSNNGFYSWNGSSYDKDADLYNGEIAEGETEAVTGDKIFESLKYKADVVVGKNIFNKENILTGHLLTNTGALVVNSGYFVSEYIPIKEGVQYVSSSNIRFSCYFDSNRNVVSGGTNTNITTFTPPLNAYYIRVTIINSGLNTTQIEEGSVATSYEDYELKIPSLNINTLSQIIEGDTVEPINSSAVEGYIDNLGLGNIELFYPNPLDPTKVEQGFFSPTTGIVNTSNTTYWYYNGRINVSEGDKVRIFKSNEDDLALTIRSIASFDVNGDIISGSDIENQTWYNVPANSATVSFSLYKSQVTTDDFTELVFSNNGYPKKNEAYIKVINPDDISSAVNQTFKGSSILCYSDSITDTEDEYISYLHTYAGFSTIRSIGIGGARIAGAYTRDDVADPYDYTTDHPTDPTDTYGDRHLYPQIIHTPNTLRHKYDLISDKYLQDDGRYIFKPDVVLIALGFNDHKDTSVDGYESYDDVKDLTVSELETRLSATVTGKKIFTYLRLALEKLMSDEIVETRDSMTYGIDCRFSKIYFVTPMGSAQSPIMDVNYGEFGDLLEKCLEDYSIKRIDGYRDFGITGKYETLGSNGRFLIDGIHPNRKGSDRIGRVVSKTIMSNY